MISSVQKLSKPAYDSGPALGTPSGRPAACVALRGSRGVLGGLISP
jgi:hypothetical protein